MAQPIYLHLSYDFGRLCLSPAPRWDFSIEADRHDAPSQPRILFKEYMPPLSATAVLHGIYYDTNSYNQNHAYSKNRHHGQHTQQSPQRARVNSLHTRSPWPHRILVYTTASLSLGVTYSGRWNLYLPDGYGNGWAFVQHPRRFNPSSLGNYLQPASSWQHDRVDLYGYCMRVPPPFPRVVVASAPHLPLQGSQREGR